MNHFSVEQARSIIASAPGVAWVNFHGEAVAPSPGQRFCEFYLREPEEGEPSVEAGSIVEYVGEGRVVSDNCDDEDKSDYAPGGEFCDFMVLQS